MKTSFLLSAVLIIGLSNLFSQEPNSTWDQLNYLTGNWIGEGSGSPGTGSGCFSFKYELDKNIMIRKSHSEYPGKKENTVIIHDDLMIIYIKDKDIPGKAIYFDNEGHVINYSIQFPDDSNIVFIVCSSDSFI